MSENDDDGMTEFLDRRFKELEKEYNGCMVFGRPLDEYTVEDRARVLFICLIGERNNHSEYKKNMEFLDEIREHRKSII